MRTHFSKGFTLIELLVVIAIIGILSSVTLATLNVARSKGADAAIKADLVTIRTQAGMFFDDNGNYGADASDCFSGLFADETIASALNHATTTGGSDGVCYSDDGDPVAGLTANSWAVSVPLRTDSTVSWCIDSREFVDVGTANVVGDVAVCVAP